MKKIRVLRILFCLLLINSNGCLKKDVGMIYYQKGLEYEKEGKLGDAIIQYKKVLEEYPHSDAATEAYSHLEHRIIVYSSGSSGYFLSEEDIEKLYKYREILLKHNKKVEDSALTHHAFGWSYFELEIYDKAIQEAKKAINLDPNKYSSYFLLGRTYEKKKMYKEALMAFEKVLEIDPTIKNHLKDFDLMKHIEDIKKKLKSDLDRGDWGQTQYCSE